MALKTILTFAAIRVEIVSLLAVLAWSFPAYAVLNESEFEEWWSRIPEDVTALKYEEAQGFLKERKWAEGTVVLKSILKDKPAFIPAILDLTRALTHQGRRGEALQMLNLRASREKGKRRRLLRSRVKVLARMFIGNETAKTFQEGLNFLNSGKHSDARERFDQVLKIEPNNVEVLLRVSQCQMLDGDHDSAAENLKKAKSLSPNQPEVQLWLGRALYQRGELNESIVELKNARTRLKRSELAPVWLAESYVTAGKTKLALAELQADIKKEPMHLHSLVALARIRFWHFSEDEKALLGAQKDLQQVMGQLEKYEKFDRSSFRTELSLDTYKPADLKKDAESLLKDIEKKITNLKQV